MDDKDENVISEEPLPSRKTALVKWTPSFAIGVSRAVYSGVTKVGAGVGKAFSKEEPPVETSGCHKVALETDIMDEVLYEFVENWEGEEPSSPLLFDPDGDFIFLPRPNEEVPVDESSAPATSSPGQPSYVYIHSALLNALQSVPSYPHNIQNYLKEHLHFPSKSSKRPLDEGDAFFSSEKTLNAVSGVGGTNPLTDRSNDQEVSGYQDKKDNQTVKKDQRKEISNSGGSPLVDVLADSVEGQVPQPQRSPRRFISASVRSPLAFRRRLHPPDQDAESARETPLTEPDGNEGQTCHQTKDFYTSCSIEEDLVVNSPEEPPVLQIPLPPSECQVLIPKPVQKHLSWIPTRSRFSFRQHSERSSDHETCETVECEIDDKKEKQTAQSGEEGDVINVSEETQVVQNPVTISKGEEVSVPSSSHRNLTWIPIKSPFSFSIKSTTSESGTNTSKVTSTRDINVKEESLTQPVQDEVVSENLNAGETQIGIPVNLPEGEVSVPPLSQRHLSWIPVWSPSRWSRPPTSDPDIKNRKETPTGDPDAENRKETPIGEVDVNEKASDTSREAQSAQVPVTLSEGEVSVPTLSQRHLSWIPVRSPVKFSRQATSNSGTEVSRESSVGEINVEVKPTGNSKESQVVQIPLDLSEGEILVPQLAQRHFTWVPVRLPFAFSQNLSSEPDSGRQGIDSCETGVKEEPIKSEEPTSPVSQASANIVDQTLEEGASSQSYWRPFPVRWLNPDTYRLLVANAIIRRAENLEVLLDDPHLRGSELLEPEIVDIDFDELKKVFSAFKALNTIKTQKAGTWSYVPVIPTIYRRYWRVPLDSNSEGQGRPLRRSSSLGCIPQESVEPSSPLDDTNNSENINFSNIHDLFKQFTIGDSLGVEPGVEMASPKDGERTTGGSLWGSFKNKMWTRANGHPNERDEKTPASSSASEESINIAPSEKSQQRASQLINQPNQDKSKVTEEWTSARKDLEDFVVKETQSLSGGLDFKKPDEESKQQDWFSSYFLSPFLSKKCYICEESLSTVTLLMRKRQDLQCKKCKHLFCRKCLMSNLQGGECLACRQDVTKQKEDKSTMGVSHSHTESFKHFRKDFNTYGWDVERHQEQLSFHPTNASLLRQCRRLTHGYKKCLEDKIDPNKMPGGGLLKRRIPSWQKPPTWIEAGTKEVRGCQLCSKERFVDPLHNCRLCGRRVCSQDSTRDFMLYIPDQNTIEYSPKMNACWKIIRVVGCPEVEPVAKLYLRICFTCQKMLVVLQEKMFTLSYVTTFPDHKKFEQTILEIHQETQKMKENIQTQLPQFVRMVDSFSADVKNISESVMKSLVKHQDDLMDQFPRYIIAVDKLREMFPQTEQQIKLVRSLMQEKRGFYRDNVIVYRVAGRQLSEILPKEEMEHRMITVNTDAINCACIVISQLAFEVLKICLQSKTSESLAMAIREVSEICEDDLKKMIEQKGNTSQHETWENHKRKLDEFVKAEMKSERRYLKVDINKQRSDDLTNFLKKESSRRIRSTLIQLKAKSASRAFIKTKEALEKLQKNDLK